MLSKIGKMLKAHECLRTYKHCHKICLTYFCFLSFCISPHPQQSRKSRVLLINDKGLELSHGVHIYNSLNGSLPVSGLTFNTFGNYVFRSLKMNVSKLSRSFQRQDPYPSVWKECIAVEKCKESPSLWSTGRHLQHQYNECVYWALY